MKKPISIINQDVLKKLLLLSKQMTDGIDQYENLGIKIHLIEEVKGNIDEIILDYLGVPPDTSLCYMGDGVNIKQYDENDEKCKNCTGCFCRDYLTDIIYDFGSGEILLEEVIEKLMKWNIEID